MRLRTRHPQNIHIITDGSENRINLPELISTWPGIFKVTVLSTFLIFILLLGIFGAIKVIKEASGDLQIKNASNGTLSFHFGENEAYHWGFSASELWSNSGIEVKEGNEISISASGQFNTSIHHLVQYGDTDISFHFPWIGPEGLRDDFTLRPSDILRYKSRLDTASPIGSLLMKVVPAKDCPLFDTSKVVFIGKNKERIRIKRDGYLFFAVNEIPFYKFDQQEKELYIIDEKEDLKYARDRTVAEQEIAWDSIRKNRDHTLWFSDNIGTIFLSIRKKSSSSFLPF